MSEIDKLRAELHAEIDRRIDAATKKAADVEPPMLTEDEHERIETRRSDFRLDARCSLRLRHVEAELARLREGLKVQGSDLPDSRFVPWTASELYDTEGARMAREIQRHRKLTVK